MNERIKELEKQSVFYNEDEEIWETDLEKFAELIVQESIQYLNSVDICIEKCYDNIQGLKEHFGVDE